MGKKLFILIFYALLPGISAFGQCINSDSLWKHLIYLRDSSTNSAGEDLQELLLLQNRLEKCPVKNDTSYALLMQRIGAAYNETGDYLQAEKYVKKAIRTISSLPGRLPVNESQLIRSYYLLELIYSSLNRTNDKFQAADSCIEISIRSNSKDKRVLYSLTDKVEYLFYIGDYHRTISYANEGEKLTSNILQSGDRLTYLFNFLIWKVNSLIYLGKYDEAENLLNENMVEFTAGGPNNFQGIILETMGEVKTKKGNYSEALGYYKKSLYYDKIKRNYLASLITLGIMGSSLYDQGLQDDTKALACYRAALAFASKIFKLPNNKDSIHATIASLEIYNFIANLYDKKGQFDSALYYYQKVFSQIKVKGTDKFFADFVNKDFLQNKSIPSVIPALIDLGNCYLKHYKKTNNSDLLSNASALYANADKLQFVIKNEQTEIQSQLHWRNFLLGRLYENAIETSRLMGNKEEAFYYFEKSRAVLLNDQLKKQLALNREDISKSGMLKTKILELKRSLLHLNPASGEYKQIQSDLFAFNEDLNILELEIKKHNPAYLKAVEDTGAIHLNDVQQIILKDHDALLELFDGESAVYSLLITAKQVYLKKIDKPDFERTSGAFISYISDISRLKSHYDLYAETAKHLFELIFDQFPLPKGRIIISPDGPNFPFEALMMNSKSTGTGYFLSDHAVSYTYSARYLLYDFSTGSTTTDSQDFLGFAPVMFTNFNLASLPGSDVSLKRIGKYFTSPDKLISAQATKRNFLENFSRHKIIQLYTHSSDSSSTGEPVIYFYDSALYLSDLISEDKPASRLFVLSACETGNGKLNKGEGIFSFNRGFAALGIPTTIANLWSVDNQSTYAVTELFYKYLSKEMPVDVALQKAKLEFIASSSKEKRLPYFWAAAIVAGKTDPVNTEKSFSWLIMILSVIVIISMLYILNPKRNKSIKR